MTETNTELLLARRELLLEQRRLTLLQENQIVFYAPHSKQQAFHAAAHFHYRYARTGNRFGKSEMGAAEDIAFALGYRPWINKKDPNCFKGIPVHPTKGLIVTTDWDKSTEVFTSQEAGINQGKLFKYIPVSALIGYTRNHSGAIDCIRVRHINGGVSVIHLDTVKSFKQNPLGQESSAWDWAHFDEPIPEAMYKAIVRGMIDRDGRVWFTCTPLTEPWIDEKFIPDLENQSHEDLNFSHGDFWMMTGSTYDNPHNTRESIDRVMSQYTEEERETRLTGIPRAYSGLVFKEFDWNQHVLQDPPKGWLDWNTPPADYCIRYAIDYHFKKNDAVLFLATSPQEITYVYAELWQQMLLEEEVREIKTVLKGHIPQPGIVDPLASTPNKLTETTAMDEYRRFGLAVNPATKDPVNGIRAVKATLKARDKHKNPVIFFNPALRRTLYEISRGFAWDETENRPIKKNDDMMECLHRLCLQGLTYIEPAGDHDYAIIAPRDFDDVALEIPDDEQPQKRSFKASRYKI